MGRHIIFIQAGQSEQDESKMRLAPDTARRTSLATSSGNVEIMDDAQRFLHYPLKRYLQHSLSESILARIPWRLEYRSSPSMVIFSY